MNSNTQIVTLATPAPQAPNQPPSRQPNPHEPAATKRPRSKIERLPRHLRQRLNQLMDDGVPYARIPAQLGPEAADITVSNLSDWFRTGHQLWLENQAWRDELHARMDSFQDLAANADPTRLSLFRFCWMLNASPFSFAPRPHSCADSGFRSQPSAYRPPRHLTPPDPSADASKTCKIVNVYRPPDGISHKYHPPPTPPFLILILLLILLLCFSALLNVECFPLLFRPPPAFLRRLRFQVSGLSPPPTALPAT